MRCGRAFPAAVKVVTGFGKGWGAVGEEMGGGDVGCGRVGRGGGGRRWSLAAAVTDGGGVGHGGVWVVGAGGRCLAATFCCIPFCPPNRPRAAPSGLGDGRVVGLSGRVGGGTRRGGGCCHPIRSRPPLSPPRGLPPPPSYDGHASRRCNQRVPASTQW